MFKITNSRKRHIRTLRSVSTHGLVIWYPANLLRMEDADDTPNETIRHLDSVPWILVSTLDTPSGNTLK